MFGRRASAACCSTWATAGGSFMWPVATEGRQADGFYPDTISTDSARSPRIMGPKSDMANCITKMLLARAWTWPRQIRAFDRRAGQSDWKVP